MDNQELHNNRLEVANLIFKQAYFGDPVFNATEWFYPVPGQNEVFQKNIRFKRDLGNNAVQEYVKEFKIAFKFNSCDITYITLGMDNGTKQFITEGAKNLIKELDKPIMEDKQMSVDDKITYLVERANKLWEDKFTEDEACIALSIYVNTNASFVQVWFEVTGKLGTLKELKHYGVKDYIAEGKTIDDALCELDECFLKVEEAKKRNEEKKVWENFDPDKFNKEANIIATGPIINNKRVVLKRIFNDLTFQYTTYEQNFRHNREGIFTRLSPAYHNLKSALNEFTKHIKTIQDR